MSPETILLIFFFVVLPLIQQLFQASRKRNPRTPERAEDKPVAPHKPPSPEPRALPHVPLPAEPAVPPVSPIAHRRKLADAIAARKPARTRDAAKMVAPRPAPRRHASIAANLGLHRPRDLRRAIVLTTILGPCRAIDPHRGPESAAPR